MAVRHGYGKIAGTDALVFAYDTGDTRNSYRGEPTVNLHPSPEDVSTWTGNLFNNWINSAYTSNVSIAPNGTLTADRLGDGYGKFNASVSITAGQTYTYSVYLRNVSLTNNFDIVYAWGLNGSLVSYGTATNVSISQLSTTEWTRVTATLTAPASGVNQVQFGPCPFTGHGNPSGQQIDVWGAMIENKSHPTQYTAGTRSATQGLLDLTGNSTPDLTNASFDSNAQITLDGTNDYIDLGSYLTGIDTSVLSIELVFRSNIGTGGYMPLLGWMENEYPHGYICTGNFTGYWGNESISFYNEGPGTTGLSFAYTNGHAFLNDSNYHHVVFILQTGAYKIYVDGSEVAVNGGFRNGSMSTTMPSNLFGYGSTPSVAVGAGSSPAAYANARIPVVKIYNRVLTSGDVRNNFNFYKGRFGM